MLIYLVYITYIVGLVGFVSFFLKLGFGKEDFYLKKRIQDLYIRELTYRKSLVQLQIFRQNPRNKDRKHEKNEDVLLLFYKRLPVLRITQIASIFLGIATLFLGIALLANKQIISFTSTELFKKGIIYVGLDIALFSGAIIILLINSVWLFFFRGRLISLLKRLNELTPEREKKSS